MADPALLGAVVLDAPLSLWALVAAVALVLLGAGLNADRRRRMAARQERLLRLVDERTRELERARRQIEEGHRELERRVEERIEARREADRTAATAEMVAALAHEVRHPIFALQAAAYVLTERLSDASPLRAQLRTLDSETRRLNELMTELLEFARPTPLQRAPTPASELIDDAVRAFRREGHDVPVQVEIALDAPEAVIDRARVVAALLSLMRNAAAHSADLTRLTLAARAWPATDGPGLRVSVTDDGRGLSPAETEHLFEPFVIGSGRGSGVGLALARRVVVAHGGRIAVESAGQGCTFHLEFLPALASVAELRDGVA
jgi:signal transduction histidine kinase